MTNFLINVSGKTLLEGGLEKKYEKYDAYRRSTSGFYPPPPKSADQNGQTASPCAAFRTSNVRLIDLTHLPAARS